MGLYVLIEKIFEDNKRVIYNFGPSREKLEQLEIIKETREIIRVKPKFKNPKIYYLIATSKIIKYIENSDTDEYPNFITVNS